MKNEAYFFDSLADALNFLSSAKHLAADELDPEERALLQSARNAINELADRVNTRLNPEEEEV